MVDLVMVKTVWYKALMINVERGNNLTTSSAERTEITAQGTHD